MILINDNKFKLRLLQGIYSGENTVISFPPLDVMPMLLNAGIDTKTYIRHFEPVNKNTPEQQFLRSTLKLNIQEFKESFWKVLREPTPFFGNFYFK